MFERLPVYQNSGSFKYKVDLDNIKNLSNHLGNPHHHFKTIHIAGTNGKGSTSHILSSILQESGYKIHVYTSPHLKDFRERVKINSGNIFAVATVCTLFLRINNILKTITFRFLK